MTTKSLLDGSERSASSRPTLTKLDGSQRSDGSSGSNSSNGRGGGGGGGSSRGRRQYDDSSPGFTPLPKMKRSSSLPSERMGNHPPPPPPDVRLVRIALDNVIRAIIRHRNVLRVKIAIEVVVHPSRKASSTGS